VAATALNQEEILAEFIAESFDFEVAHARIVQKPKALSPSSSPKVGLLYAAQLIRQELQNSRGGSMLETGPT
jgi:hypothetical protein